MRNTFNRFTLLLGFSLCAHAEIGPVCLPPSDAPLTSEMRRNIADWLYWQETEEDYNCCGGVYREPPLEGFTAELPGKEDTRIQADEVSASVTGQSILTGHVILTRPNMQMTADKAYLYRDSKTNQITQINFFGHVSFREPGKILYGDEGHYLPQKEEGYLDNALYSMSLEQKRQLGGDELLKAWGRAQSIERDQQIYYLEDATYTTCPPEDSAWSVKAQKMELNKETGRGEATHAFLDFHDTPVFYWPYYNFPIDDRRQSGFLMPTAGYSNNLGFSISAPYYWNMAPNYDMVITPSYYSDRGVNLGGDFRYLTKNSTGELALNGIMDDQAFKTFVQDNEAETGNLSDDRYEAYLKNSTKFNQNWSVNANYHKVSDDYYLQDFGTDINETTENQLLQQVDLDYHDEHWSSIAALQHYQTLQPFNQTVTADVYSRYPQWILNGHYSDLPGGVNFTINNEYDNFVWTGSNEEAEALGDRYHTNPIFTLPLINSSGYIKPVLQMQETYYGLSQNPTDLDQEINVLVPQASLDSSVYFDRSASFWSKEWTQTLEPRIYYLYTPYVNQTEVPNFDSAYNIFTYDQLFRSNRFSGLDRVGDANQVSLALMSRFMDAESGWEAFHWGVGQTYYFMDRQVQLMQQTSPDEEYADSSTTTAGYTSPTSSYSPVASQIAYYFDPTWSLVGDGAWDPLTQDTNNATINLHYQPGINQIINLGYSFLVNGDQTGVEDTTIDDANLNQVMTSFAWPFTPNRQWSVFGTWTQNVSHNYPMNYSAGLQYEDCCWAVRFFGGKIYDSLDADNNPQYNNSVYLQLLLKGIGNIGNDSSGSAIASIPGYQDIFAP